MGLVTTEELCKVVWVIIIKNFMQREIQTDRQTDRQRQRHRERERGTNEMFIELSCLPMSNREVGVHKQS